MTKLYTRYTDFGVIGGFFIALEIMLWTWFFPETLNNSLTSITHYISSLSKDLAPSLSLVLNTIIIAVIVIFCVVVGFFIHLLSDISVFDRPRLFNQCIRENNE